MRVPRQGNFPNLKSGLKVCEGRLLDALVFLREGSREKKSELLFQEKDDFSVNAGTVDFFFAYFK